MGKYFCVKTKVAIDATGKVSDRDTAVEYMKLEERPKDTRLIEECKWFDYETEKEAYDEYLRRASNGDTDMERRLRDGR